MQWQRHLFIHCDRSHSSEGLFQTKILQVPMPSRGSGGLFERWRKTMRSQQEQSFVRRIVFVAGAAINATSLSGTPVNSLLH